MSNDPRTHPSAPNHDQGPSGSRPTTAPEDPGTVSDGPQFNPRQAPGDTADPDGLQASVLRRPPGIGQRIAFAAALLFYLCSVLSLGALFYWVDDLGGEHPIIASLGASVVFFIGAGIVLHVIGRANLPDLGFSHKDPT